MPISYTQSYLNQLPWATRMVCELSAYSAGKGQPEESTLLPQLFTHSSLDSLDWRIKNSKQEKKVSEQQAEIQESDRSSGTSCNGGCPLWIGLSIAMNPWLSWDLVKCGGHLCSSHCPVSLCYTLMLKAFSWSLEVTESNILRWKRTPNHQIPPSDWVL